MSRQEDDAKLAMAHMEAQVQVHGVASIKVKDGEIFMFSREIVEKLMAQMKDTDQDRVLVFVKTGSVLTKEILS